MANWEHYIAGRRLTFEELKQALSYDDVVFETVLPQLTTYEAISTEPLCCQRCGNQKPENFFGFQGVGQTHCYYCLVCLAMGRILSGMQLFSYPMVTFSSLASSPMTWRGELSLEQAEISQQLVIGLADGSPQLVWAVTGAGKTEMLFEVVSYVLQSGGVVGIASPRIDVILELAPRFQQAFAAIEQQVLYGDGGDVYQARRLTLATTHQLWRCDRMFDLLIVDEVDAFPYAGDATLHHAVQRALKVDGHLIYLTATPDNVLLQQIAKEELILHLLPARYHRHALPEPLFGYIGDWASELARGRIKRRLRHYLWRLLALEGSKLIFVPHIQQAVQLAEYLNQHYSIDKVAFVHAQDKERYDKVQALRQGQLEILVTTTILERGVTFKQCQLAVVGADDVIFSSAALVQMSGRAGRHRDFPTGAVWWLHNGVSEAMVQAQKQILQMNQCARQKGLIDDD